MQNGTKTNHQGINFIISKLFVTRWITLNSIFSWKATVKCCIGHKKEERYPQVKEVILSFITEIRAKELPIIHKATVAREIAKFRTIDGQNLKTIEGWSKQITYWAGLSLRHTISIYQKLPADFEHTALNFQHDAIEKN